MSAYISDLKKFKKNNYLSVNLTLLKIYGPEPAVYLSNLIDSFLYFQKRNKTTEDNFFFYPHIKQAKRLKIPEKQIKKLKSSFIKLGVIETKIVKSFPNNQELYKINIEKIIDIVKD